MSGLLQSGSGSSTGKALVGCGRLVVVGALSSLEPLAWMRRRRRSASRPTRMIAAGIKIQRASTTGCSFAKSTLLSFGQLGPPALILVQVFPGSALGRPYYVDREFRAGVDREVGVGEEPARRFADLRVFIRVLIVASFRGPSAGTAAIGCNICTHGDKGSQNPPWRRPVGGAGRVVGASFEKRTGGLQRHVARSTSCPLLR